jgi:hypothetical protein
MTEKEKIEFEELTNREFMIWANKELNNKIIDIEKLIGFVAAEVERRKMTMNVDKIAVMIMQMTMKTSAKIVNDISSSIEDAYKTTDFLENMPVELQKILADVLEQDVEKRLRMEHEKVNKKLNIEKEDIFRTKPV